MADILIDTQPEYVVVQENGVIDIATEYMVVRNSRWHTTSFTYQLGLAPGQTVSVSTVHNPARDVIVLDSANPAAANLETFGLSGNLIYIKSKALVNVFNDVVLTAVRSIQTNTTFYKKIKIKTFELNNLTTQSLLTNVCSGKLGSLLTDANMVLNSATVGAITTFEFIIGAFSYNLYLESPIGGDRPHRLSIRGSSLNPYTFNADENVL